MDHVIADTVGAVNLEIDGICYPAYYGMSRDDAVEALKSGGARYSGFKREFSRSQLPPGKRRTALRVLANDGPRFLATPPPAEFDIVA